MQNTYWNDAGKYQKEYESLSHLVPVYGQADTMAGEAIRITQNAYYDLYNNGGCNQRLDELTFVYDWLHKHAPDEFDTRKDMLGTIDYRQLYRDIDDDGDYFKAIALKLEHIADLVYKTAYKLENSK